MVVGEGGSRVGSGASGFSRYYATLRGYPKKNMLTAEFHESAENFHPRLCLIVAGFDSLWLISAHDLAT